MPKEKKEDPRLPAWKEKIGLDVFDAIEKGKAPVQFETMKEGQVVNPTVPAIASLVSALEWRYTDPVINAIFSQANTYQVLLDAEGKLALSQAELGMIPAEDAEMISSVTLADAPPEKIWYIEDKITKHDVNALIQSIQEAIQKKYGKTTQFIHYGATSFDVRDNGEAKQATWAAQRIRELALDFANSTLDFASNKMFEENLETHERNDIIVAGRTHGQYALPLLLAHRYIAKYLRSIVEEIEELDTLIPKIKGKGIKGAVGTAASYVRIVENDINKDPDKRVMYAEKLQEHKDLFTPQEYDEVYQAVHRGFFLAGGKESGVATGFLEDAHKENAKQLAIFVYQAMERLFEQKYDLPSEPITVQTTNRKIYAKLGDHMKAICLPVAQFASDQWLSQMQGISFEGGSVPSSAMPSKRNPGNSENIQGTYLLLEGLGGAYRNAITNFERHLSDSAYNRLFVPLVYQLAAHILTRGKDVVDDLDISVAAIKKDFDAGRAMMAGEAVKYELVARGKTTVEAHSIVKESYKKSWDNLEDGIGGLSREEVEAIAANIGKDYLGISQYVTKTQLKELGSRIAALQK